jgi:putative Holliday junction resolvase
MPLSIHPKLVLLHDLTNYIKRPCRLAALDIGRKTIGIALTTPDWQMVTPLTTLHRKTLPYDIKALEKALHGFDIQAILVGLPINMDDTEGPQAIYVREVIDALLTETPAFLKNCYFSFADERLSTSGAENTLQDHMSRFDAKASGALDAVAAQYILERALKIVS